MSIENFQLITMHLINNSPNRFKFSLPKSECKLALKISSEVVAALYSMSMAVGSSLTGSLVAAEKAYNL